MILAAAQEYYEEDFDQSFTGIVLTFEPNSGFCKSGAKPNMLSALKKRLEVCADLIFVILVGLLLSRSGSGLFHFIFKNICR